MLNECFDRFEIRRPSRLRIIAGKWRENPRTAVKQITPHVLDAAHRGAGNGVTADEANAGRQCPRGVHRFDLGAADVGDERVAADAISHRSQDSDVGPDRRTEDDEIAAFGQRQCLAAFVGEVRT